MTKKLIIFFKLLISLFFLFIIFKYFNFEKLKYLDSHSLVYIFFAIIIYFFLLIFMAYRCQIILKIKCKIKYSLKLSYLGYLKGMFFNLFLPGSIGGDIYRVKYLSDSAKLNLKDASIIIFTERVYGLLGLLFVFLAGISLNYNIYFEISNKINLISFLLLFFIVLFFLFKFFISKYLKIDLKNFIFLTFLSIIPHFAEMLNIFIFANYLNLNITFINLLFIMPLVYLAIVLPISFGGLGVREGVLAFLLTFFGASLDEGILVSFLLLIVLISIAGVGYFFLIKYKSPR